MKTIKPLSTFLLLFSFSLFYTQTWSFDINDYTVAGTKTGIIAGLGGEIYLKDEQNKLIEKLIKLEKEIDDKKSVANINSLALAAASIATIETTKKDIKNIKKVINIIKFNPLFLKHSLGKKSEELDIENRYLEEADSDYKRYLASGLLSGGLGQFYTVFGKLLTRILKIRAIVLSIKKDIESLSVINKVLLNN
ncbi:hypothetical protein WH221_05845 [Chryseobacterium culicis]|uniref:DUF4142 domain-containing protein n=1 Tax=Chryseobacterium culicis TaxID=680127 RepID=A0A2S9CZ40_CHRCI|nr:hypothetical protein [Chryseobacterium culicis]PRB85769.1 hypothetical protein CQ022_05805 [Chryseobacterium culicis]PRB90507.1 hypothetical protein CQ033_07180 [Chryseobacterium culicis]